MDSSQIDALVEKILKLPVGSSVTDIEDCIRAENWARGSLFDPDNADEQIEYVRKALMILLSAY